MTFKDARDQIAVKEGHADWLTLIFRENLTSVLLLDEQAAELYESTKNETYKKQIKTLIEHGTIEQIENRQLIQTLAHPMENNKAPLSLQEIKDQVAREQGYTKWENIEDYAKRGTLPIKTFIYFNDQVAELYAKQFAPVTEQKQESVDLPYDYHNYQVFHTDGKTRVSFSYGNSYSLLKELDGWWVADKVVVVDVADRKIKRLLLKSEPLSLSNNESQEERIICAAIWYKDFEAPAHTVKNKSKGVVLCGHRHAQIIHQHVRLIGMKQHEMGEHEQGFLTSQNRFVDRVEAMAIAKKAGQLINPHPQKQLYSEDIY